MRNKPSVPAGRFGRKRQAAVASGRRPSQLSALNFQLHFVALLLLFVFPAGAQERPYIGFVYPAGGQRHNTFEVRVGGQGLDDVQSAIVSGSGVTARLTQNYRRLQLDELQLLGEQLRILNRRTLSVSARAVMMDIQPDTMAESAGEPSGASEQRPEDQAAVRTLIDRIERRMSEHVVSPDCPAIASLVLLELTISPEADPGERELRLVTLRGVSNPLPFHVGQLPEVSSRPMRTSTLQILGKEAQALRKSIDGESEILIPIPCTVNGQIGSGEEDRYRFSAKRGQRLVVTTLGRQLVPFIADAVPGWFQPILSLFDASGREVAFGDDYYYKPDPTVFFEVPDDGEYVFAVRDSLYRGREDFVYRITIGELPFITSAFPGGAAVGATVSPELKGWNLGASRLIMPDTDAAPGAHSLCAARNDLVSNRVPFLLDCLPELLEREPNDTAESAQAVTLPAIVNGRIQAQDDRDCFTFSGRAGQVLVAEVTARRLDSPLDSILGLISGSAKLLAFNDDCADVADGLNTHHADSSLVAVLPEDGPYQVQIGDTARQGGSDYVYRLRLSDPRPGFDLRVVPSSLSLQSKSTATLTVYAQRKDGFSGPIEVSLKNPPPGFSAVPVTLSGTQSVATLAIKTDLVRTPAPLPLAVVGKATISGKALVEEALPAEDRMQAFLWRHLVPAQNLLAFVFDTSYQPPPRRIAPARKVAARIAPVSTNAPAGTNSVAPPNPPRPTKEQLAAQLKQLRFLYEEGMLTDDFFLEKAAELNALK